MKKTKVCSYCGKRKKTEKFMPTGRMCKSCKSEYDKQIYSERKDEIDTRAKTYGKTERGRETNRRASAKYRKDGRGTAKSKRWYSKLKRDPEAYMEYLQRKRANNSVRYALKTGKLIKGICEVCGSKNVQAHHDDYDKKLDVRWLCPLHHGTTRRIGE